jgi:hypothetical protein
MVAEVLTSAITLMNGLTIECFPCTLRSLRGWTIPVGVLDELAFFRLEGQADSDVEVQASVRRGMLGFPAPRLVKISTPYMRSGVLWDDFRKAWGQDNPDLLVWKAATATMNPSIRPAALERERWLDPDRFAREYEREFTEDLETFPAGRLDRRRGRARPARAPTAGRRSLRSRRGSVRRRAGRLHAGHRPYEGDRPGPADRPACHAGMGLPAV